MTEKKKTAIGVALLLCGLVCITVGIYRDEVSAVYFKAIKICMECIGID